MLTCNHKELFLLDLQEALKILQDTRQLKQLVHDHKSQIAEERQTALDVRQELGAVSC